MNAKDVEVGKFYGKRKSYGNGLVRVKVLSVGEKPIPYHRKGRKGIEIQHDNGHVEVVYGYYIVRPWEEYAQEQTAKDRRQQESARHYKAREAMRQRLGYCLQIAGLEHAKSFHYPEYVDVRLATAEQMEILCNALELAAHMGRPSNQQVETGQVAGSEEIAISGANIHMAMRKYLDSPQSSNLYDAISACPDSVWETILLAWSRAEGDTIEEQFANIDWPNIGLANDSRAIPVRIGFQALDPQEWAILAKAVGP